MKRVVVTGIGIVSCLEIAKKGLSISSELKIRNIFFRRVQRT